jgi:hypothetical protein
MPAVAAWIDELRAALGRELVDEAIRSGMRDGTFRATEGGHEVGARPPDDSDRAITLDRMARGPYNGVWQWPTIVRKKCDV